jgi:hypothetical protein
MIDALRDIVRQPFFPFAGLGRKIALNFDAE